MAHLPAIAKLTVSLSTLSIPEPVWWNEGRDVRHIPAFSVMNLPKRCYSNPNWEGGHLHPAIMGSATRSHYLKCTTMSPP